MRICGLDTLLYLTFLRFSAYLFGISKLFSASNTVVVSFFCLFVLIPIYYTSPVEEGKAEITSMARLTILNASNQYYRMFAAFFFTVLFSTFGHFFIYIYEERRNRWVRKRDKDGLINEIEISKRSLLLRGLNSKLPLKYIQNKMDYVFGSKLFGQLSKEESVAFQLFHKQQANNPIKGKLIKVQVVSNYQQLSSMLTELQAIKDAKLEILSKHHERPLEHPSMNGSFMDDNSPGSGFVFDFKDMHMDGTDTYAIQYRGACKCCQIPVMSQLASLEQQYFNLRHKIEQIEQ